MSETMFNPKDLVPLTRLCADREIPQAWLTVQRLAKKGKFPAWKIGGEWQTTVAAVRSYYWKQGNEAARKATV